MHHHDKFYFNFLLENPVCDGNILNYIGCYPLHGGLESTFIQKKMPGFYTHFFDEVYPKPKDYKNAHIEIFHPCPGEKIRFFKFTY